tara:strand:- start:37749 stop:38765 length:1017 start_codon:yes stop_codon:yes gene_type:complete
VTKSGFVAALVSQKAFTYCRAQEACASIKGTQVSTSIQPVISVVIPAYNREDVIERAIQSLLAQQCDVPFEVVVVNDGSTDHTAEVVRDITDPKLRLVNQENQGASAARIHGVTVSRGDYIAFLDSDDVAEPHYLQCLYEALVAHPECVMAYAKVGEMDGSWHQEQALPDTDPDGVLADPLTALLQNGCFTISMNLMATKAAAKKAMQGRQHVLASNDFDFCLRVALQGPYVYVDRITICIDRRDDGIGKRFGYRQVSFAVLVASEAVKLSLRKDEAVKRALTSRIRLLWPTAFGQCLAHKQWGFAWKVLMQGLKWGTLSDAKQVYWAVDHYVIKKQP